MVLSVLFGKKYPKGRVTGTVGSIELDVTLVEEHSYSSRVTNYPVEISNTGKSNIISDHIINEPERVILQGIVSDTPIGLLTFSNRSVDAFNRLIAIHQNREVVTLVTGIKVYTDMALISLDVPRDIKTGQSLRFNLEFQKIVFDNSVRLTLLEATPFGGVQDKIPREIVAENTNYPIIQNDPPFSLKDQSASGVDIGVQSLLPVPSAIQAKLDESLVLLVGLA